MSEQGIATRFLMTDVDRGQVRAVATSALVVAWLAGALGTVLVGGAIAHGVAGTGSAAGAICAAAVLAAFMGGVGFFAATLGRAARALVQDGNNDQAEILPAIGNFRALVALQGLLVLLLVIGVCCGASVSLKSTASPTPMTTPTSF